MPKVEFLQRRRLKKGAAIFDLEENQGVVAIVLSCEVREDGLVVTEEGTWHNVGVAPENCRLNGIHIL